MKAVRKVRKGMVRCWACKGHGWIRRPPSVVKEPCTTCAGRKRLTWSEAYARVA